MAPLWRWSEELRPRAGKDEALSAEDSEGRKKFVPFNRLVIKIDVGKSPQNISKKGEHSYFVSIYVWKIICMKYYMCYFQLDNAANFEVHFKEEGSGPVCSVLVEEEQEKKTSQV